MWLKSYVRYATLQQHIDTTWFNLMTLDSQVKMPLAKSSQPVRLEKNLEEYKYSPGRIVR